MNCSELEILHDVLWRIQPARGMLRLVSEGIEETHFIRFAIESNNKSPLRRAELRYERSEANERRIK